MPLMDIRERSGRTGAFPDPAIPGGETPPARYKSYSGPFSVTASLLGIKFS